MCEAGGPRLSVSCEANRAFDLAELPQCNCEVKHRRDARVLPDAECEIVISARLKQGERALIVMARFDELRGVLRVLSSMAVHPARSC